MQSAVAEAAARVVEPADNAGEPSAPTQVAPIDVAPDAPAPRAMAGEDRVPDTPAHYLAGLFLLALLLIGSIVIGNRLLTPWLHMPVYVEDIGKTLLDGQNYAVFDLNVDIRGIRRAQFAGMPKAPEVMVLGASHWQEASADLLPGHEVLNAHVHRDYYDDIVAAVGLLIVNDKLPQRLVISIRDSTFTSPQNRTDYLWLPFIPDYRAAEELFGIEPRSLLDDIHPRQIWNFFSLPALVDTSKRWIRADAIPGPTDQVELPRLDVLQSDGSIRWSREHLAEFTPERSRRLALEMARSVQNRKPELNPRAIAAVETVLKDLQERQVEVLLVHPPFNPLFYAAITGTTYEQGLHDVASLTREMAGKYGFRVAGSFDPKPIGCTSDMYIDAEHGNPNCMRLVLANIASRFKD